MAGLTWIHFSWAGSDERGSYRQSAAYKLCLEAQAAHLFL